MKIILLRNFIPSTEDHVYQLEKKLISVDDNFKNFGGFKSYRLLRPVKGTTYKIYFGFADRQTYEDFKNSDAFKDHFFKRSIKSLLWFKRTTFKLFLKDIYTQ